MMTIGQSQILEKLPQRKMGQGESLIKFKQTCNVENFPQAFADYLSNKGNIYYWQPDKIHVITKYDDACTILNSSEFTADRSAFVISQMPNVDISLVTSFFSITQKMMVMSDGKDHEIRRKSASMGIRELWVNSFQPTVRKMVKSLLDDIAGEQEVEFVSQMARLLPSQVLAELFSIPEADRNFFRSCADTMTAFFGGGVAYTNDVAIKTNQVAASLREYFSDLIQQRRKNPQDDFISGMLEAQKQYSLSEDEIISQATLMLVAGQVTTTDQICNNLFLLLNNPDILQAIRANPELLPHALEEFKRIDPAVTFLFRVAKADTVINGQQIYAGEAVFISNHCVNRDLPETENPAQICIERKGIRNFAFGHGAHYCIGARLGRLQIQELFASMMARFPNLQLSHKHFPERDHYSLAFSGFKTLPILCI